MRLEIALAFDGHVADRAWQAQVGTVVLQEMLSQDFPPGESPSANVADVRTEMGEMVPLEGSCFGKTLLADGTRIWTAI